MKKLCLLILLCLAAFAKKAHATSYYEYTYKTSCLPNVKEFRADRKVFFDVRDDADWLQKAEKHGLYRLNVDTYEEKPLPREESCTIDGVEYRMKFIPILVREYYGRHETAVQLYAGKKYRGILFPFGADYDDGYDSVGIKDGKIFVRGCIYEATNISYCLYDYKELDMPEETSYELILADKNKVVFPEFNIVELNCYEDLEKGFVELRSYKEESELPENYYRLKDNPKLTCGRASIKFKADGSVIVSKDEKTYADFNPALCNKQIYQIAFDASLLAGFYIKYFDKKELYSNSRFCSEKEECSGCNMFKEIN